MRFSIFSLALLKAALLASLSSMALAETKPEGTIYFIDVQKVIDGSIVGKAARNNVEGEIKKSEARLMQVRQEVEKLKADLEKQASVLSKDALDEKREVLDKKGRDFQRAVQDQREELSRKNDVEMQKVLGEVQKVIAEMAAKEKYPLIIERDPRMVLYSAEKYDLTDQVIKALDTKKIEF
jgi:outer membrane protein